MALRWEVSNFLRRVGLRLEHSLRENAARPVARGRRRSRCGMHQRASIRPPRCDKASRPSSKLVFRNAKSRRDFLRRLAGKSSIGNQLKLPFGWFAGPSHTPVGLRERV